MTGPVAFLITGPSAAGKSTVAQLLAGRFPRSACVEGDAFRRSIVSGRCEMAPDPSPEALKQLRLRYRIATAAADAYFDAGFTVVIEDVIAGPLLREVIDLVRSRPLHVFVLLPRLEVVAAREALRAQSGYERWPAEALYELFAEQTHRIGTWIDASDQTPDETVDAILSSVAA
jgi:chloramphenicol 3-O-phosphotransferase